VSNAGPWSAVTLPELDRNVACEDVDVDNPHKIGSVYLLRMRTRSRRRQRRERQGRPQFPRKSSLCFAEICTAAGVFLNIRANKVCIWPGLGFITHVSPLGTCHIESMYPTSGVHVHTLVAAVQDVPRIRTSPPHPRIRTSPPFWKVLNTVLYW
jgi:hypothetical protein